MRLQTLEGHVTAQGGRLGNLERATLKGRRLEGFRWYRALRLSNVPNDPQSPGEGTSVVFEMDCQSDFGNTATRQTSRIVGSFGVRGGTPGAPDLGISPVLTVHGDRRLGGHGAHVGLRVYLNDDGHYWLYIRTAVYSASQIRYFVPNEDAGSDPFEETGIITHDGFDWVVPTPTGSGTLIWDYATAHNFQPFVIGKGFALTNTDQTGLAVAGPNGDATLPAGVWVRLSLDRVLYDLSGRIEVAQSHYVPLAAANGNSQLGGAVYDYGLELLVDAPAGASLRVQVQRAELPAQREHVAPLRGGPELVTLHGTVYNDPWRPMWVDVQCSAAATLRAGSVLTVKRGYGL